MKHNKEAVFVSKTENIFKKAFLQALLTSL